MRACGWILVVVLIVLSTWALLSDFHSVPLPNEIIAETANQLKETPEGLRPELLGILESRLPIESVQVFLAQGVPGQDAIILALPYDSSEEEQASHWPIPWPRLSELLAQGPTHPQDVSEQRKGIRYVHHVYPVDVAAKQYLVLTTPFHSSMIGQSLPWIGLGFAVLFAVLLWYSRHNA